MLAFFERSMIYPAPQADKNPQLARSPHFEEVTFTSADGTRLHGLFAEHPNAKGAILVCHGNGEDVSYMSEELHDLRARFQRNVLAFDYRGYGKSDGKPFEAGVLEDGEAALRWLVERTGVQPDKIILWGRSLGGAVAVHLAAQNGAHCLVLDRTFKSMVDVAQWHLPWLPVSLLLRNRYPSYQRIESYSGPLFQVHGHADQVVPFRSAADLHAASPSQRKQFIALDSLGHNTPWPDEVFQSLDEFLLSSE